MKTQDLINYSLSTETVTSVADPLWNDVKLLMPLDDRDAQGLPWYRDYSKQIHPTQHWPSSFNVGAELIDNTHPAYIPNEHIAAYTYLNNKQGHADIIAALNAGTFIQPESCRLYTKYGYTDIPEMGSADFCIEVSFYVEQLNLPWRIQTITSQGAPFVLNNDTTFTSATISSDILEPPTLSRVDALYYGWAIYVKDSTLRFVATNNSYVILPNIATNTWYHVAVQRSNGQLKTYVNGVCTNTYAYTNTHVTAVTVLPQYDNRAICLGAASFVFTASSYYASSQPAETYTGYTSLSGGIAHFRWTQAKRYTQDIYTVKLPFVVYNPTYPIDPNYNNTLFNLPATYDLFDYGPAKASFEEAKTEVPNPLTGFIELNGQTTYVSKSLNDALGSSFTIEWEQAPFFNHFPLNLKGNRGVHSLANYDQASSITSFIYNSPTISVLNSGANYIEMALPILELTTSTEKKILKVVFKSGYRSSLYATSGQVYITYYEVQLSTDGNTWTIPSSTGNQTITNTPLTYFNASSYIFGVSATSNYGFSFVPTAIPVLSATTPINSHIAIQKQGTTLVVLINAATALSVPCPSTLYSEGTDLIVKLGGYNDEHPIVLRNTTLNTNHQGVFTWGLRGVKITNTALYNSNDLNNIGTFRRKIIQYPFKVPENSSLVPSRGRVLDITYIDSYLSNADEVSWYVYVNRHLSNLTLADFSLTQLNGLSGANLLSLNKITEYKYIITASTGTGNGTLTCNFIDRNTVQFSSNNAVISNILGELNLTGDTYVIKKNNPLPTLSSGANPYVKDSFYVEVSFDAPIATFVPEKIAINNAKIVRVDVLDVVNSVYRLTVLPTSEGVITLQALTGTGVTTGGLFSNVSEVFTRVYSEYFTILQLPLDVANTNKDLSAARLLLDDVIDGNTSYSVVAPAGQLSSLEIIPSTETSGFTYPFNAVNGLGYLDNTADWTIEWFSRTDTSISGATTHLFSLENGNLGFCVYAKNRNIYFARNYDQKADILSGLVLNEKHQTAAIAWTNTAFSVAQKYQHFAITKNDNVFRFYVNGLRIRLIQSSASVDIRQGTLKVGYFKNYVGDSPGFIAGIRFTYGKALYTSRNVNIPSLPYPVPVNILEYTSLVNNIIAYSDNNLSNTAVIGNRIYVQFYTLIPLDISEISLTIEELPANVIKQDNNRYAGYITVDESFTTSKFFTFSLGINSNLAPSATFTETTNYSNVFIDVNPFEIEILPYAASVDTLHIFDVVFAFNKPVDSFTGSEVTVTNAVIVNFQALENNTKYKASVIAQQTGDVFIEIEEGNLADNLGLPNLASNVFSKAVIVPLYSPDPYWNNVVILLNEAVELKNNAEIDTNTSISLDTAPIGLTSSIYFDGVDDYLTIDTGTYISKNSAFTLELWLRIASSSILTLVQPSIYNATSITANSFVANWAVDSNADDYKLQIAFDPLFDNILPEYDYVSTGKVGLYAITGSDSSDIPKPKNNRYKTQNSFLMEWDSVASNVLGYKIDVALDANFTKKLKQYDGAALSSKNVIIGDIKKTLQLQPPPTLVPTTTVPVINADNSPNIIIGGIYNFNNFPSLAYFKEESSLRYYPEDGYCKPIIEEDVETQKWVHVAIVSDGKYSYLYFDGNRIDRVKNAADMPSLLNFGYHIGHFHGYMTGIRLTEGVQRYTTETYRPPLLPYPTS